MSKRRRSEFKLMRSTQRIPQHTISATLPSSYRNVLNSVEIWRSSDFLTETRMHSFFRRGVVRTRQTLQQWDNGRGHFAAVRTGYLAAFQPAINRTVSLSFTGILHWLICIAALYKFLLYLYLYLYWICTGDRRTAACRIPQWNTDLYCTVSRVKLSLAPDYDRHHDDKPTDEWINSVWRVYIQAVTGRRSENHTDQSVAWKSRIHIVNIYK